MNLFRFLCNCLPSYRQRERISQYLIDIKQQLSEIQMNQNKYEENISFLTPFGQIHFWLPYANTDILQKQIAYTHNFHEFDTLKFIRNLLPKNPIVADIGANIGNHTIFFSKICMAKRVYSFEPQNEMFNILQKNIEINQCEGVELFHFALGSRKGTLSIFDFDPTNWGGTSFIPDENGNIPVETFDSLNIPRIDFMKIDVESAEVCVLQGAIKTITRDKPMIWCEALNSAALKAINRVLAPLNYSFIKLNQSNFLWQQK